MYRGTNASAGIGIGKAVVIKEEEFIIRQDKAADTEAEVLRFHGALEKAGARTRALAAELAAKAGEAEAEILEGHLMLLADPVLTGEIEIAIQEEGSAASMRLKRSAPAMRLSLRPWMMN